MLLMATDSLEYGVLPGRRAANPFAGHDGDGVSVRLVEVSPGPRRPHRHPHSPEVIYVLEGTGRHRQGDEERVLGPRDLVLVPTDVPHCTSAEGSSPLRLLCFFPHPDLVANIIEETDSCTSS